MSHAVAELGGYGLLAVTGEDARPFLHAQLSNDIEHLAPERGRYAAYCSPKGRVLASLLVIPHPGGFLLQLARDLAPAIAKRLAMFILRSRVKLADASDTWAQFGAWGAAPRLGAQPPAQELDVAAANGMVLVKVAPDRFLVLAPAAQASALRVQGSAGGEQRWALEEIRCGRPLITQATQDRFVPQMANLELIGAVDFKKGCYPGQEIVARAQYRATLKRRLYRGRTAAEARAGQDLFGDDLPGQASGTVVNAAASPDGGFELLAVLQIASVEANAAIRVASADGPLLEVLPLPYRT